MKLPRLEKELNHQRIYHSIIWCYWDHRQAVEQTEKIILLRSLYIKLHWLITIFPHFWLQSFVPEGKKRDQLCRTRCQTTSAAITAFQCIFIYGQPCMLSMCQIHEKWRNPVNSTGMELRTEMPDNMLMRQLKTFNNLGTDWITISKRPVILFHHMTW